MRHLKTGATGKNRNKGFTLTEMLIVVGVLVVLFAVGMASLFTIRRNLRQRELDSKAEMIYMAAQNRLAVLRASGYEAQYTPHDGSDIVQLGYKPFDADDTNTELDENTLYYVQSSTKLTDGSAAAAILPESAVDAELWDHCWRVEYDPVSGGVYAVFYTEQDAFPEGSLNPLRVRGKRLSDGAKVGYYGGDITRSNSTYTLAPSIDIVNAEKLIATFYSNNPTGDRLTFRVDVSDGTSTYTKTIRNAELRQLNSTTWYCDWVLDALDSDDARFYAQTGGKLKCGTDITIKLTVTSDDPQVDQMSVSRRTNSLFAYQDGTAADTALVAYGRHLQNLDTDSHVTEKITKAIQISDVSFQNDASKTDDWYTYYTENGVAFQPIENSNLRAYNGAADIGGETRYCVISGLQIPAQTGNAGLFATITSSAGSKNELKNITMTGTKLAGGSASGALAGTVSGTLSIENCRVYLSEKKGDLTGVTAVKDAKSVQPWLQGEVAGGLIGRAATGCSITITQSHASTVIQGMQSAGGLIGAAAGSISVESSYADCYLTAASTGGLVGQAAGTAAVSFRNFYAAGYQTATTAAAGFMPGGVQTMENGYSACALLRDDAAQDGTYTAYTTAQSAADVDNIYYLGSSSHNLPDTQAINYKELRAQDAAERFGALFTMSSGDATFPYNLMDQGLNYYTYPRLAALAHYGDWQAEFDDGALVYFERYVDTDGSESYGFYGANLSTLASDKLAIGDGYALAFSDPLENGWEKSVSYAVAAGEKTITLNAQNASVITVENEGQRYYLVPLSAEIVNTTYIDTSAPDAFYQKITADNVEYWYNPHFAKTVTVNDTKPTAPDVVSVRTARQLNALSRHYASYASATGGSEFRQELDIDYTKYLWNSYAGGKTVTAQEPIGSGSTAFTAEYDGGGHIITGVSFTSSSMRIGLFGTVAARGSLHDIVLIASRSSTSANGTQSVSFDGQHISGSASQVHMGVLAGYNSGTIYNCAASGFTMWFYGYRMSSISLGGLVGSNYGTIRGCSAATPQVDFANTNAVSYVAGFAGSNHGDISSSYALGAIRVLSARNSTVWIAGFTADNSNGLVRRSYSATALTASGTAESYGFARSGGAVSGCYYLDGGTYAYRGELYAYNTSNNEFKDNAVGTPITGSDLQTLRLAGFGTAQNTYGAEMTVTQDRMDYPYPASVTDANGANVHFGDWPVQEDIGTLGVFYWEYEFGGSNSGYHFSYAGTSQGIEITSAQAATDETGTGTGTDTVTQDLLKGNSLCTEHDDGGVVTEYGYGYFYKNDNTETVTLTGTNCVLGAENTAAGAALGRQMPGYTFCAYQTGSMYLTSADANSVWTLRYGRVASYEYSVCPFFADSISLDTISIGSGTNAQQTQTDEAKPGTETNAYQIRSVAQLQYINWNYKKLTADYSITKSEVSEALSRNPARACFPYLVYSEPPHNNLDAKDKNLYWKQSHDVDSYLEKGNTYAEGDGTLFTPIGSLYDNSEALNTAYSNPYAAYFDSSYDGQAYAIKNIEIHSTTQCLGLFGVTIGAKLKNIVLYSNRGNKVWNMPEGGNWYCMGGLVGLAANRRKADSAFENCTVSGYTILDQRSKGYEHLTNNNTNPYSPGWGGGCVGGLVGATNMDITRCTAVTDITLDIGYWIGWNNLRVGGVAGVCRGTVTYCYAGGSIVSTKKVYKHTLNWGSSTSIWVGGIVGGIVMRDEGSLMNLLGSVTKEVHVKNCYSFVQVPSWDGDTWVMGSHSIASNGEMQFHFRLVDNPVIYIENCYTLQSTAVNSEDYKRYTKEYRPYYGEPNWSSGWNMNSWGKDENAKEKNRAIMIYNDTNPYLAYGDMQQSGATDTLVTQLNKYLQAGEIGFGRVTKTENGANIDGKYSFPGGDAQLQGLNYPFPTILQQQDVFGTVNVHYGAWPKIGLYWESNAAEIDLLAASDETTESGTLKMKLYLQGVSAGTQKPTITILDEDGNAMDGTAAAAIVADIGDYQAQGGYYEVTFRGQSVGMVIARAQLGTTGYTADLSLQVTAGLNLTALPANVQLCVGDKTPVTLTVKDARGNALPEDAALTWDVHVDNGGSQTAIVECTEEITRNDDGTFNLNVSGFYPGEAAIRVTCTYMPDPAKPDETVYATIHLSATCRQSVIGLSDGTVYNQAFVPAAVQGSVITGSDTTPDSAPRISSPLFLYATRSAAAGLDSFTIESAELTLDGEEQPLDASQYEIVLGTVDTATSSVYDCRPVEIRSAAAGDATLVLTVHRGDSEPRDSFTLTIGCTLTVTTYKVEFYLPNFYTPIKTLHVPYGTVLTLDYLHVNGVPTSLSWNLPSDPVTSDLQIEASYSYDESGDPDGILPEQQNEQTGQP